MYYSLGAKKNGTRTAEQRVNDSHMTAISAVASRKILRLCETLDIDNPAQVRDGYARGVFSQMYCVEY